jgi:HK97 gp10 family phage protein
MATGAAKITGTTFRILNPDAPRQVCDADIADVANRLLLEAQNRSPYDSGTLSDGYKVEKLADAVYRVYNEVYYARFVEFGTKDMPAQPAFGQAITAARRAFRASRK